MSYSLYSSTVKFYWFVCAIFVEIICYLFTDLFVEKSKHGFRGPISKADFTSVKMEESGKVGERRRH